MIPCKHCNTLNGLDSTFCKRCGAGLPEDEITSAKAKLEKVVEEGVHALNLGRVEEAMAIAEMAVASDPSMAAAYTLKASAHERKGQIVEALECAERLVELYPDLELDKIKRNQLRAALGASALQNRPPSRMVAGVAAASVVAIVLCAGVLTVKYMNRPVDRRVVMGTPSQHYPIIQNTPNPNSSQDLQSAQTPTQTQGSDQGGDQPGQTTPQGYVKPPSGYVKPSTGGGSDTDSGSGDSGGATLPQTGKGSDPPPTPENPNLGLTPLTPPVPHEIQAPSPAPQRTGVAVNTGDPAPVADSNGSTTAQTPPSDPGEIDIRISNSGMGTRPKSGSSQDNPKDTSKIFMKMGNDYYQMGNYSGAAASLEKAVSSGADPVNANYRLAQSYNSLGKKSDAIDAYKRTVAACTSSLNSGKGNSAKLRALRDASETALRQLQGG